MINPESHKTRDVSLGIAEALPVVSSDLARYWAKVERRSDSECWLWTASTFRNGYGQFRLQLPGADGKQKTVLAHRLAWQLYHGEWPSLSVLHRCDTPRCQNPAHLFLGDHTANMRDASQKRRLHVPHPNARKLTPEQRLEMVERYRAGGVAFADLGDQYGVSRQFVAKLLREHNAGRRKRKAA